MANRDDQPFRGLEPDHYRRSGLKDAVSHYLSPPNPLTSTAPQPFPNNLTMPAAQTPAAKRKCDRTTICPQPRKPLLAQRLPHSGIVRPLGVGALQAKSART